MNMVKKNKYKSKVEEIQALFDRYKKMSNAIYWTGILNIVSLLLYIFKLDKCLSLGYGVNILIHYLIDGKINNLWLYIILFIVSLIIGLLYLFLSLKIKKGKLIPLIITLVLYTADLFILPFIPLEYFKETYNQYISYGVHIIVMFYLFYLLYLFHKIVKLSYENQNK